jgi:hypothetical protein
MSPVEAMELLIDKMSKSNANEEFLMMMQGGRVGAAFHDRWALGPQRLSNSCPWPSVHSKISTWILVSVENTEGSSPPDTGAPGGGCLQNHAWLLFARY